MPARAFTDCELQQRLVDLGAAAWDRGDNFYEMGRAVHQNANCIGFDLSAESQLSPVEMNGTKTWAFSSDSFPGTLVRQVVRNKNGSVEIKMEGGETFSTSQRDTILCEASAIAGILV